MSAPKQRVIPSSAVSSVARGSGGRGRSGRMTLPQQSEKIG